MNKLTSSQIKGKIKNLALKNQADARTLIRIFMMERFLDRLSQSQYKNNFILKGGILITSLIGISLRSTLDIDVSIKDYNLSINEINKTINEICLIDSHDGISFRLNNIENIMDDMEYPGFRVFIVSTMEKLVVPFSIDISTGDAITPKEISYKYHFLLEDGYINIWTYNIETIIAEKLETIFSRGILNTRMRDFYDIYILTLKYKNNISTDILKKAFEATCKNRQSNFSKPEMKSIIDNISNDEKIVNLWTAYSLKYYFANEIQFKNILEIIKNYINYL